MCGDPGVERLAGAAQKSLQPSIGWHHEIRRQVRVTGARRHDHKAVRVTHHAAGGHNVFPAGMKVRGGKR